MAIFSPRSRAARRRRTAGRAPGGRGGRGGWGAGAGVGGVVADGGDLLAAVAGREETQDRRLHAVQEEGIVELVEGRVEEAPGFLLVHHAPAGQGRRGPGRDAR